MALLTQYARKPLILPKKGILVDSSLVLNAVLWHPHSSLSPFLTKDKNQHSCTVTGAIWGYQGRTFDGDDYITIVHNNVLNIANSNFTIELWYKPTTAPVNFLHTLRKSPTGLGVGWRLTAYGTGLLIEARSASGGVSFTSARIYPTLNVWNCCLWTGSWSGTSLTIQAYKDSVVGGAQTQTCDFDMNNALDLFVNSGVTWTNYIGEIRIYSRILSLAEIMRNHLATKWRYQ